MSEVEGTSCVHASCALLRIPHFFRLYKLYRLSLWKQIQFQLGNRTSANFPMQQYAITDRPRKQQQMASPSQLVGAVSTKLILLDRKKQKFKHYFPCQNHSSANRSPTKETIKTSRNDMSRWTFKQKLDFIGKNRLQIKKTFDRLWPILKYILEKYRSQKIELLKRKQQQIQHYSTCEFTNFLKKKEQEPLDETCKLTFFRACCNKYSEYTRVLEEFFKVNKNHNFTKDEVKLIRRQLKNKCKKYQERNTLDQKSNPISGDILQNDKTVHNLLGCCRQKNIKSKGKQYSSNTDSLELSNTQRKCFMTSYQSDVIQYQHNKSSTISQNSLEWKQLIPKLKKDLTILKQSELFKKIQKCSDGKIYSLIAQGLEFLQRKINILSAVANICSEEELQHCIELKEKFAKTIKIKSQKNPSLRQRNLDIQSKNGFSTKNDGFGTKKSHFRATHNPFSRLSQQTDVENNAQRKPKMLTDLLNRRSSIFDNKQKQKQNQQMNKNSSKLKKAIKTLSIFTLNDPKQFNPTHLKQSSKLSSQSKDSEKSMHKSKRALKTIQNQQIKEKNQDQSNKTPSSSASSKEKDLNKQQEKKIQQNLQIRRKRARRAKIKRIGLFNIDEYNQLIEPQKLQKQKSKSIKQNSKQDQQIDTAQFKLKRLSLRKSLTSNGGLSNRLSGGSRYSRRTTNIKPDVVEFTHKWNDDNVVEEQTSVQALTNKQTDSNFTERDLVKELLMVFNAQAEAEKNPPSAAEKNPPPKVEPIDYSTFKDEPLNINVRENFMQNREKVLQECHKIQYFLRKVKSQQNFDKIIDDAESEGLKVLTKAQIQKQIETQLKWIDTQQMKKTYVQLQQGIQQFKKDYQKRCSRKGHHIADFFLNMFHFCVLRVQDQFPEFLDFADFKKKYKKNSVREAAFLPNLDIIHDTIRIAHRDFEKKLIDFCCTFERIQQKQVIQQQDLPCKAIFSSCRPPKTVK